MQQVAEADGIALLLNVIRQVAGATQLNALILLFNLSQLGASCDIWPRPELTRPSAASNRKMIANTSCATLQTLLSLSDDNIIQRVLQIVHNISVDGTSFPRHCYRHMCWVSLAWSSRSSFLFLASRQYWAHLMARLTRARPGESSRGGHAAPGCRAAGEPEGTAGEPHGGHPRLLHEHRGSRGVAPSRSRADPPRALDRPDGPARTRSSLLERASCAL